MGRSDRDYSTGYGYISDSNFLIEKENSVEKLVFKKQKYPSNDNYYRCRITAEAKGIIDDVTMKTNLNEKEVVSKMILFAYEHLEIEEEKCQ